MRSPAAAAPTRTPPATCGEPETTSASRSPSHSTPDTRGRRGASRPTTNTPRPLPSGYEYLGADGPDDRRGRVADSPPEISSRACIAGKQAPPLHRRLRALTLHDVRGLDERPENGIPPRAIRRAFIASC